MNKFLIVRLSSFGDIFHNLSIIPNLKESFPNSEIHWVIRSDFAPLLEKQPHINKLWSFSRQQGLRGWFSLCLELRRQGYTHIYDAHNNLRSNILLAIFRPRSKNFKPPKIIQRSKERWKRFLLFYLGINRFPQPYIAADSYLKPLEQWKVSQRTLDYPYQTVQLKTVHSRDRDIESLCSKPFVALAPSAAWQMKRWPQKHWAHTIQLCQNLRFIILGGSTDHFCSELEAIAPQRTVNLAGQLELRESIAVLSRAAALVSNDTGLLHAADLMAIPSLALIGPTAFGYPKRKTSRVLQTNISCRPCSKDGRGKCRQKVFQRCLVDIQPQTVCKELSKVLALPTAQAYQR